MEVLGKYNCKLPLLPEANFSHSMVVTNNNELLVLGGHSLNQKGPNDKAKICLIYKDNEWRHHSMFNLKRAYSCAITMPDGIYVFGGTLFDTPSSHYSCELLPNNQSQWNVIDASFPRFGMMMAHCVAISSSKILFTGGVRPVSKRLTTFDTMNKTWKNEGKLIHERWGHASFQFNGKVIITGGKNDTDVLRSTEVLTLKSMKLKEGGRLNEPRWGHGMGIIDVKGIQKLVVFGGSPEKSPFLLSDDADEIQLTSIEAWNDVEECWVTTDLHLPDGLSHFAFCSKTDFNKYRKSEKKSSALAKLNKFLRPKFIK